MNKITIQHLAGALFCLALSQTSFAQVAVVAGAKSDVPTLTKDQVAGLYVGSSFTLPGGGSVNLLDQSESSDARKQFYGKVTDKSQSQIKATWSRLTFSGKGTPPKEMGSSADVKKAVAASPNTIGYIEKSAVDSSVKVVFSAD